MTNKLVNEHGINAANITTDWKGDTVQPFPNDNDKNRCVIIKGVGNARFSPGGDLTTEQAILIVYRTYTYLSGK